MLVFIVVIYLIFIVVIYLLLYILVFIVVIYFIIYILSLCHVYANGKCHTNNKEISRYDRTYSKTALLRLHYEGPFIVPFRVYAMKQSTTKGKTRSLAINKWLSSV